jgi:hypothetical protein
VREELVARFGAARVKMLEKAGKLRLVQSVKDLPDLSNLVAGEYSVKQDEFNKDEWVIVDNEGFEVFTESPFKSYSAAYDALFEIAGNDFLGNVGGLNVKNETGNTVYLVADNIQQGDAWGVFLHEAGEHAGLEAMVGAVYLDRDFHFCKKFILKRIIIHFDLDNIITTTTNFKSKIIEWGQRENSEIDFKTISVNGEQRFKEFIVELHVNRQLLAIGKGATKKKAEQEAAKNACEILQIAV